MIDVQKLSVRLLVLVSVTLLAASASLAGVFDRTVPGTEETLNSQTMAPTGRIIIKFSETSALEVSETGIIGGDAQTRQRVNGLLTQHAKQAGVQRHFAASMQDIETNRLQGERKVRHSLPNLNAYGSLDFSDRARDRHYLLQVLKSLLADPAVETAFLEPIAVPASLGFDAFTGTFNPPAVNEDHDLLKSLTQPSSSVLSDTPDFTSAQGYLGAAPQGVNALAVAEVPGARGAGLNIVDVEGAWIWAHEDLPDPMYDPGPHRPEQTWRDHGTAVIGTIGGLDNGYGITGITPEVGIGGVSIQAYTTANAINAAWRAVNPGDCVVIELHAPGPNSDGNGQFGYVPMEYWQDNFDVIQIAAANGRIVCEAAGNGSQDLDDEVYGVTFDREYRDSGAIMVGAANHAGNPEWFTNYGSRVDLNGWGSSVTTLAYGDLQGAPSHPETEFYTSYFSGTSSATPIVTGAVLALQGIVKEGADATLDPILMREILVQTGSPANGTKHIGPRPDILAAWAETEIGFGTVAGVISDSDSGLPIAGAMVHPVDTDYEVLTNENGEFSLGFPAGPVGLEISSYFHESQTVNLEVVAGETTNLPINLTALPTVNYTGHISSQIDGDLTGVRATVLGSPLIASSVDANGNFTVEGAPEGQPFSILVDGVTLHGADVMHLTPIADSRNFQPLYFQLAEVEHTFELWWENFSDVNNNWTWGVPANAEVTAFSGEKCWGIGMDGTGYPENTAAYLFSGSYNFFGSEQVLLSFHYYCDTEAGFDGVKLQVRNNNDWVDIMPESEYDSDRIQALNAAPGWTGQSEGWRGAVFDLLPYTENLIELRFMFASDLGISEGGFYIDDVTFDMGDITSAVELHPGLVAPFAPRVHAFPNPFNPQTEIAWEISRPGDLNIEIFDTRGRRVRVLHDGPVSATYGRTLFNGRNDQGAKLSSGMYLVQVRDGAGMQKTTRISLVK